MVRSQIASSNGMRMRPRRALAAIVVAVGALAALPGAANAAAGLSAIVQFDNPVVTVGDVNRGGELTFTNANSAPDVGATVCRHDDLLAGPFPSCDGAEGIVVTASCGAQFANGICRPSASPPSGVDADVFFIHPTAVGTAGACNGTNFTAVPVGNELGKFRFDPPTGTHVVLPANGSLCTIRFTFDVLRAPTLDIRPLIAGLQTAQVVEVTEHSSFGNLGAGQGTSTPTTVSRAAPSIATIASGDIIVGAGVLTDQATVSGLVNPIAGATVTFRLYGPNDGNCTGTPVFTQVVPLVLGAGNTTGTAQSGSYTPTAAGVYRWIASYSGDANNADIAGPCGEATETRTVTTPPPPPPPPGSPPPPPPPGSPPPPPPTPPCTPPPGPVPPGGPPLCEEPPIPCTPPPGPAPAGGELCARGTAAIRGTTGCAALPFNVVVTGRQIRQVTFALDGRVVRTLRSPNSGSRFVYRINPRTRSVGVHRVIARTLFNANSGTKARVLRVTFSRCARRAASPAFTG